MKIIVSEVGKNEEWAMYAGITKYEPEEIIYDEFDQIIDGVIYLIFEKGFGVKKTRVRV